MNESIEPPLASKEVVPSKQPDAQASVPDTLRTSSANVSDAVANVVPQQVKRPQPKTHKDVGGAWRIHY